MQYHPIKFIEYIHVQLSNYSNSMLKITKDMGFAIESMGLQNLKG